MTNKIFLPDIDGVLVLSEVLHVEKNLALAAQHDITITQDIWDTELHGIGDHRIYLWLAERGLPLDEAEYLSSCENYYAENSARLKPRPGARALLEHFQQASWPILPVSSGVASQVEANLALFPDFDFVERVTANDVTKTKPDPEPYLQGMNKACVARGWVLGEDCVPSDFITVEDSASGIKAAKAAGILAVHWLLSVDHVPSEEADFVVKTEAEVLHAVQSLTHRP
jgi:HAD superfamily hydrolase (TIGR01509 family)